MKSLLRLLLIVIVVFLAYVASRPGTFHIERSARIAAPADVVFAKIADFHQWAAWSPWEKLDPQMVKTFGGPESGTGATYHWVGNKDVGEGNMAITEARPNDKVTIKLDFIKPFAASNITTFTLAPAGSGTKVTWAMDGANNFMAKAMSIFMNMDKMIGGDFEKGLASLQGLAEAAPAPPAAANADSTRAGGAASTH
jgi:carbon monoxide dehydrogenase subunit G